MLGWSELGHLQRGSLYTQPAAHQRPTRLLAHAWSRHAPSCVAHPSPDHHGSACSEVKREVKAGAPRRQGEKSAGRDGSWGQAPPGPRHLGGRGRPQLSPVPVTEPGGARSFPPSWQVFGGHHLLSPLRSALLRRPPPGSAPRNLPGQRSVCLADAVALREAPTPGHIPAQPWLRSRGTGIQCAERRRNQEEMEAVTEGKRPRGQPEEGGAAPGTEQRPGVWPG